MTEATEAAARLEFETSDGLQVRVTLEVRDPEGRDADGITDTLLDCLQQAIEDIDLDGGDYHYPAYAVEESFQ